MTELGFATLFTLAFYGAWLGALVAASQAGKGWISFGASHRRP